MYVPNFNEIGHYLNFYQSAASIQKMVNRKKKLITSSVSHQPTPSH